MPLVLGKNVLIESDLSYCHDNRLSGMIRSFAYDLLKQRATPFFSV